MPHKHGGQLLPDYIAGRLGPELPVDVQRAHTPGHAGYTGIALIDSGSFVVPYAQAAQAWLIGDDDDLTFEIEQQTGSSVSLGYYNTSTDFQHGWQVRITYTPMSVMQTSNDVIVTPDVADWAQAIEGTTGG